MIKLSAEAVKGSSLSLEGIDDVHGSHSLSVSVLSVSDGVSDDISEESGEDVSDFLVDVEGDSLDTAASGESSDGRLGDAFDQRSRGLLGVALDADLADSLAAFSSFSDTSHLLSSRTTWLK